MLSKASVLLVDDDAPVRQALEQALSGEDFHVVAAANGEEALRGFCENPIDVVLLDLDLGRDSGSRTFERLKRIHPRVPIILMTARPEPCAAATAPRAEATMEKPLDLPLLFRTVTALATAARKDPFRRRRVDEGRPESGMDDVN